jgi:hypothetical protein
MADDDTEQNPFSRPGFIVGAVVVAALVVVGIVLAIITASQGNDDGAAPVPTNAPSVTPTGPSAPPASNDESVCGLGGVEVEGSVTVAPSAEWQYQDVYAYPVSTTAGPAETAAEGFRYCFQHTPEGALFAAANAVVVGFGPEDQRHAFLDYALTDGVYREELLTADGAAGPSDVRASIAGFRFLAYDGDTARVDVAFQGSSGGQSVTGSVVFELVWADGDWKLDANRAEPARVAQLPDLSGYVSWSEG